jgi:hypothetical protein
MRYIAPGGRHLAFGGKLPLSALDLLEWEARYISKILGRLGTPNFPLAGCGPEL